MTKKIINDETQSVIYKFIELKVNVNWQLYHSKSGQDSYFTTSPQPPSFSKLNSISHMI